MTALLHNILICTVSGSIMFGLGTLFNLSFSKRSMSRWYYGIIILSLIMLLVPPEFGGSLPKLINISLPAETAAAPAPISGAAEGAARSGSSLIQIIFTVWAVIASALAVRNIVLYIRASRTIKRISRPCDNAETLRICEKLRKELGVRSRVRVMVSGETASPLLFGILRPRIIIPDRGFDAESLRLIFAHELTHLRHRDLLVKLLGIAAGCVHWFNPLIYPLRRSLNTVCELCCDESVLKKLRLADNKDYGRLIISVVEDGGAGYAAYSTSMASAKSSMKKRLSRIARFKEITGALKMISVLTAAALAVCSMTAFGFTRAAEVVPEEISSVFRPQGGGTVVSRFSAAMRETPAPTQTETPSPELTAGETENEARLPNGPEYAPDDQPVYDLTGGSAEIISEENTEPQYAEPETEPEYSEPEAQTVVAPAVIAPPSAPTEAPKAAETVKVPGVSSYVINLEYDDSGKAASPILEAASTTKLSFNLTNMISGVEIYACGKNGENARKVYESADGSITSFTLPVTEGECCFAVFTRHDRAPGPTNTLIIN